MIKVSTLTPWLFFVLISCGLSTFGQCTLNAGPDQYVCAATTTSIQLAGTSDFTGWAWSTSGTGTFSPNNTTLDAVYTPSPEDIESGAVVLGMYYESINCMVDDMMSIVFTDPVANAGDDFTMCSFGASLASDCRGVLTWSSSGTGQFVDEEIAVNPIYIPSAADIANGSVILTVSVTDPLQICANTETDEVTVTIESSNASVNAGPDQALNAGGNVIDATINEVVATYWKTEGSGEFFPDNSALNITYSPSNYDMDDQFVLLTLDGYTVSGCKVSDNINLDFTLSRRESLLSEVQVYPNPFANQVSVTLGDFNGLVKMKVLNTSGVVVWQENSMVQAHAPLTLSGLQGLASGVYQLVITSDTQQFTARLVK
ncbi:MAG: T9SS type A sorting domain-containing protein [Cytophagaceae bacterium]|nr:T9SS type A sorting domain-containing protein [Cytophagaceae bacterium]